MNQELLSKLHADSASKLEEVRKGRKALEHAIARIQPFLSKYIFDASAAQAVEFRVCTKGPVCCTRGSLDLLAQLKELAANKDDVSVTEFGCLRRCGRGPNIESGGVVFTDMTTERTKALFDNEVGKKGLPVDLLLDDEYAPEVLNTEDKRIRLLLAADELATLYSSLEDQMKVLAKRLPVDRTKRFLAQRAILEATKLHGQLASELNDCEELLKKVVPLDRFAGRLFEREFDAWLKNVRPKKWTFQS
ncbi:MAG: (2Fe-2S) ferredoxin domain-containing protein [Candidatus Obscuribacterales bacterium]|jgi:(2Fe-2S) ferredoxin|nr:(2Fe-2S) ferredoxin domain-containing protein [Candidatus Obscuribacterales bacterium]